MPFYFFLWTDEIVAHLAEHDLLPEDFERVVSKPVKQDFSNSSGSPAAFGYTDDGRYIIAVYDLLDDMTILPITAYEVPEPREGSAMNNEKRIYGTLTAAQKRRVKKVQGKIANDLPNLIRRNQQAHDAMKEKTLSGVVRKSIHHSKILLPDLAVRAHVEMKDLADFLTGQKPLPSDAIDRLVKVLKLKLPTSRPKAGPRRAKAG